MGLYADRFRSKTKFKIISFEYDNETYYMRELSVAQKMYVMGLKTTEEQSATEMYSYFAKMAVMSLCDENGNLTEDPDDTVIIDSIPSSLMELLIKKVMEVNGLTEQAQNELKKD